MSRSNRRDPRVPLNLDVFVHTAKGEDQYKTKNVSFRGVFMVCEDPLPLRQIVRFRTMLDDDQELHMLGLVAHRVNQADAKELGSRPGMGIQLYSVGKATRKRWVDFVQHLVERDPALIRAIEERNLPHLRIRLSTEEKLRHFQEEELRMGKVFYRTPDPLPRGARVVCNVTHPTHDGIFDIHATVGDRSEGGKRSRGMFLLLTDVDDDMRASFGDFATGVSLEEES